MSYPQQPSGPGYNPPGQDPAQNVGQSPYGGSSQYGAPQQPNPQQPSYQQPQQPAYQQPQQPSYPQPGYQQPSYPQPQQPSYPQPGGPAQQQGYGGQPYGSPGYTPPKTGPSVDLAKVDPLDWAAMATGLLALIFSFFAYYSYKAKGSCDSSFGPCKVTNSAWHGFLGWFGVLLALIAAIVVAVAVFAPSLKLPVPTRLIALGGFVLGLVFTLLALLVTPDGEYKGATIPSDSSQVNAGVGWSYWIVLLLILGGAVVSFLSFQRSGGVAAMKGSGGQPGLGGGSAGFGAPGGFGGQSGHASPGGQSGYGPAAGYGQPQPGGYGQFGAPQSPPPSYGDQGQQAPGQQTPGQQTPGQSQTAPQQWAAADQPTTQQPQWGSQPQDQGQPPAAGQPTSQAPQGSSAPATPPASWMPPAPSQQAPSQQAPSQQAPSQQAPSQQFPHYGPPEGATVNLSREDLQRMSEQYPGPQQGSPASGPDQPGEQSGEQSGEQGHQH